jgi:hypothetical protein
MLLENERIPMIEIRQIVDDIRQAERELSALQTSGKSQPQVEKTSKAIEDQRLNWSVSA